MKIEVDGFPGGIPPGTYDVEPVEVVQHEDAEPVLKLRFTNVPPPGPKPVKYLLVGVEEWAEDNVTVYLDVTAGVRTVDVHGPGCCCKNCPWNGNHGDGGKHERGNESLLLGVDRSVGPRC